MSSFKHLYVYQLQSYSGEYTGPKFYPKSGNCFKFSGHIKYLEKNLKMHNDQASIRLLKSLNFILIHCLQISSFVNVLEVPTQNVRLQK